MNTNIIVFPRYRRIEMRLIKKIAALLKRLKGAAAEGFRAAGRVMIRPYTLTLIPHSGKRFRSIRVNLAGILCVCLGLTLLTGAAGWYAAAAYSAGRNLDGRNRELQMTERSVREMQDEIARLLASFGAMKDTLLETFSALGLEPPSLPPETADTDEIHRLSLYLAGSARRLSELGAALEFRNAILAEIPSIWPVKGGGGYLTAAFGAAVHPISGQRYLHRGIDISTRRQGDPLVATANGEIVTAEFDLKGGFGNTIVIRHANGFYSRYSHMLSFLVKTGQKVKQGEVIGFIGNTGLSTGPHLHYEIHWGSALVDPLKYIYRPYSPPPPGPAKPANLAEAERPARKAIPAAAYQ